MTNLLIGAHCSAAGGVHKALLEGQEIGATTIQLFTANQRRWDPKPLAQEEIDRWFAALEETGLEQIISHNSYLTNLGTPNQENLTKSKKAFREELERCLALDLSYMNFHPGSHLDDSPESSLDRIANCLLEYEKMLEGGSLRLLLEATAGQGTNLGNRFEHLAYIIDRVQGKLPIGVCIDTCHIFAAGYDIRNKEAWDATLKEFDKVVGLKHLYALHLNDSKHGLGSRKDRHAPLGEGEIGMDCFETVVTHPKLRKLPMYLETPGGPENWKKEIKKLRALADKKETAHK